MLTNCDWCRLPLLALCGGALAGERMLMEHLRGPLDLDLSGQVRESWMKQITTIFCYIVFSPLVFSFFTPVCACSTHLVPGLNRVSILIAVGVCLPARPYGLRFCGVWAVLVMYTCQHFVGCGQSL
jgi:hypothetical protein